MADALRRAEQEEMDLSCCRFWMNAGESTPWHGDPGVSSSPELNVLKMCGVASETQAVFA